MSAGMAEMTEYERAQVHFELRDYLEAARLLAPLAAEQPRSVSVRLLLARAYYHSAQLRRAESEFRAVTELDPVEDYAWFGLGRALERQGKHAQALACFRVAAAMRPSPDYRDAVIRSESNQVTPPPDGIAATQDAPRAAESDADAAAEGAN